MRTARAKVIGKGAHYYITNRIGGKKGKTMFTPEAVNKLTEIVQDLTKLYTVQPLFLRVNGNTMHMVVYAPGQGPSLPETAERYNAFYPKLEQLAPRGPKCAAVSKQLPDISRFMSRVQNMFTHWYNEKYPSQSREHLWADRFKSIIIDSFPPPPVAVPAAAKKSAKADKKAVPPAPAAKPAKAAKKIAAPAPVKAPAPAKVDKKADKKVAKKAVVPVAAPAKADKKAVKTVVKPAAKAVAKNKKR